MRYENGYYFQSCVADSTKRALVECDEPIAPGYGGYYGTQYVGDDQMWAPVTPVPGLAEFLERWRKINLVCDLGIPLRLLDPVRWKRENHDPGDEHP